MVSSHPGMSSSRRWESSMGLETLAPAPIHSDREKNAGYLHIHANRIVKLQNFKGMN